MITWTCRANFYRCTTINSDLVCSSRGMWLFLHFWRNNPVAICCATSRHPIFDNLRSYFRVSADVDLANFAPKKCPSHMSVKATSKTKTKTVNTSSLLWLRMNWYEQKGCKTCHRFFIDWVQWQYCDVKVHNRWLADHFWCPIFVVQSRMFWHYVGQR